MTTTSTNYYIDALVSLGDKQKILPIVYPIMIQILDIYESCIDKNISDDDEYESPINRPKRKKSSERKRHLFTDDKLRVIEKFFSKQNYPT